MVQVFADRGLQSFLGSAWKFDTQHLLTCWHVIGTGYSQGPYGQQKPHGPPIHSVVFVVDSSGRGARCLVHPHHFNSSDLAVLLVSPEQPADSADFESVPALRFTRGNSGLADQTTCVAVGFTSGGDLRSTDGRVQEDYMSSTGECLFSAFADHGMSGGVVVDLHARVVGMITGAVGQRQSKSRMLQGTAMRVLLGVESQ